MHSTSIGSHHACSPDLSVRYQSSRHMHVSTRVTLSIVRAVEPPPRSQIPSFWGAGGSIYYHSGVICIAAMTRVRFVLVPADPRLSKKPETVSRPLSVCCL